MAIHIGATALAMFLFAAGGAQGIPGPTAPAISPDDAPVSAPAASVLKSNRPAHGGAPAMKTLTDAMRPFVDAFNKDKDKPRIVALLSPT